MEKLEKQKHDKIQGMLTKPPEKRTTEELVELAKLLMQVNFLKQFSTNPDFIEMCRYLSLEECTEKQIIFRQGDEGDNFYIIMKGKVGVYVSKTLNKYKNFNYLKEIAILESGQSFGELALLYNSVRAASIITLEETELIVLNRDTFKKYIHNIQTSHLNQIVGFYEHLLLFKNMDKNDLIKLASKSLMKKYRSKIYLIKQNEEASCIFFIKSGLVQVTRKIKFKLDSSMNNNYDEPNEEEILKGNYIEYDLKICELGKGQYFSDYEVINKKKMQYSVLTLLPTTVIMLSEYDFKLQINEENIKIWLRFMKLYPSDVEIRKRYIETQYWNKYKHAVMTNHLTEINFHKKTKSSIDRDLPIIKKDATLKRIFEPNDNVTIKSLVYDLDKQTNFNEFLPLSQNFQNTTQYEEDVPSSPFSAMSSFKQTPHYVKTMTKLNLARLPYTLNNSNKSKSSVKQNLNRFYSLKKNLILKNSSNYNKPKKNKKIDGILGEIIKLEKMGITKIGNKILPKLNFNNTSGALNNVLNSV